MSYPLLEKSLHGQGGVSTPVHGDHGASLLAGHLQPPSPVAAVDRGHAQPKAMAGQGAAVGPLVQGHLLQHRTAVEEALAGGLLALGHAPAPVHHHHLQPARLLPQD